MIIDNIINQNRLYDILWKRVLNVSGEENHIIRQMIEYIEAYLEFNRITTDQVISSYNAFMADYNRCMKNYLRTRLYPLLCNMELWCPSREQYDIILMLSCILSTHRFRIMELLKEKVSQQHSALYIGVGSGLELELTHNKFNHLDAYDFQLNKFLFHRFPEVFFHEKIFTGLAQQNYDAIFIIELLEHIENPYELLRLCHEALKWNGNVYLTTATNIPQFDHIYNFPENNEEFVSVIKREGFDVAYMETIPHLSITIEIKSKNDFYVLMKNNHKCK